MALTKNSPLLTCGIGQQDVFKKQPHLQVQLEYISPYQWIGGRWLVGGSYTEHRASYVYSGFLWEVPLGDTPFLLIPSLCPGLYFQGGGKNLGHIFEFFSRIGLAYQFSTGGRMGWYLGHMSNASIVEHNPGQETSIFYLAFPL